jgi:hypothetical protein
VVVLVLVLDLPLLLPPPEGKSQAIPSTEGANARGLACASPARIAQEEAMSSLQGTFHRITLGARSGVAAGAPLAALTEVWTKLAPASVRTHIPFADLLRVVETKLHAKNDDAELQPAPVVSPATLSAVGGAAYALVARHLPGPALVRGAAFGLIVLGASAATRVPGLRLFPALGHVSRFDWLNVLGHVVWGAALGSLVEAGEESGAHEGAADDAQTLTVT